MMSRNLYTFLKLDLLALVFLAGTTAEAADPGQYLLTATKLQGAIVGAKTALLRAADHVAQTDWTDALASLLERRQPRVTNTTPEDSDVSAFSRTQLGPFDDLILAAAKRWNINPFLFKGLIANESNLEPLRFGKRSYGQRNGVRVVVSGGAIGIAQFSGGGIRAVRSLREKRRRRGARVGGFDLDRALVPQEAIFAAAELLDHLIRRYGRDGGITAYNSGVIGGLAVWRLGFWRARRAGKLKRSGIYLVQGERFLLNVLRRANRYRKSAGLRALDAPARGRAPMVASNSGDRLL